MKSNRGTDMPNQFIITTPEARIFQSYTSIIAIKYFDGRVELDANNRDYSPTTNKHRNIFLGEDKKETQKNISDGVYTLINPLVEIG